MHKVAVLAGGVSFEREVSLRSGRRVAEALEDRGHAVRRLDLDDQLVRSLAEEGFDAAFLALHGRAGEDGTIQGLLELLGIPYTGPDATASALAWDKAVCKGLWRRGGLPTADFVALSSEAIRGMGAAGALDRVIDRLGMPLVVKPSQGGASLGVRTVHARDDLAAALIGSFSYHDLVLVERFVRGPEVAVSVVGGDALPVVEIVPKEGSYDFSARYTAGATEFFVPARLDPAVEERCRAVALAACEALGCQTLARADMIIDSSSFQPFLLEVDTCPGMTETSLLPMAARAAGWSFVELCERLIDLARRGP